MVSPICFATLAMRFLAGKRLVYGDEFCLFIGGLGLSFKSGDGFFSGDVLWIC